MIPVSVIVTTRNEAAQIGRCLAALKNFSETVVVDSGSDDETQELARAAGARVAGFTWNGNYPKKRQWCLDHLSLKHDWIFFVDADEVVTPELASEIAALFASGPAYAGYFVKGRYVLEGTVLRHGLQNNKLCLFDRRRMEFPAVDDLDIPGMGEMEGHYQPVLKAGHAGEKTGALRHALLHYAYERNWTARHERYAAWERGMNRKGAWPRDPVAARQFLKRVFRALPARPVWAFLHCYVVKGGLLDGRAGLRLACDRFRYYRLIAGL